MLKFWMTMREFFEGEDSVLSMTRLLCFLSFFPASWVTIKIQNENALAIYVGTYALSYLGGKGLDAVKRMKSTTITNNVEKADVTVQSAA
jgi:hypothetical protein